MREASSTRNAFHWRMRAEEMRTMADNCRAPENKMMLQAIANDYDRLAVCAEDAVTHDLAMAQIMGRYETFIAVNRSREASSD